MRIILALLLATAAAWADPKSPIPPRTLTPYTGEFFYSAPANLTIATSQNEDTAKRRDSYLQLFTGGIDLKVIASIHWPDRHDFNVQWSPTGKYVAVGYHRPPHDTGDLAVFQPTRKALRELSLPNLTIAAFLPKNDPAWRLPLYVQETLPYRWLDKTHLLIKLLAYFRSSNGYTKASYDIVCAFGRKITVISAKQTGYVVNK